MILCCFICVNQRDSKSLAAYSSVNHMRFLMLSLLLLFSINKTGSFILILGHGFSSTIIFYLIGYFYNNKGSRIIYYLNGGLISSLFFSLLVSLTILSNSGFPPSISFFFEFCGISGGLLVNIFLVLSFFIYFIFSFYFSIYFIVSVFIGKKIIFIEVGCLISGYFILLITYNLLFF